MSAPEVSSPSLPAPNATAEQLTRLAREPSPQVRGAVARHPNTPAGVLGQLAADFPEAVIANPALPLLRLAQMNQIQSWSGRTLARLAAVEAAPEWLQEQAMRHPDPQAQWAVAGRAQLSPERLRQLATRREWQLRAAVAQHPNLPTDLLDRLAADSDYGVRLSLAAHPALPPEVLKKLQQDPHPLVRRRTQIISTRIINAKARSL
ncbi:hypothetical protein GCM10022631_06180 [Deinococcus rubellus]|uniref:Leucine rich repeat variant n=1 Tax=Deinococcus rubellus TaxID=1889240 RepID=A0ABY5YG30_9DEIO|nr:hypothetical protein [Deinococcus rubellus]UWX64034.1 hypothetical protein N0D28_15175 [Deinococcus rubellus]